MSTDLVRKLRVMGQNYHSTVTVFEVAADEIERIQVLELGLTIEKNALITKVERLHKRVKELEALEAVKPGILV